MEDLHRCSRSLQHCTRPCTIGIKQLLASAAEHKLLPALVRVLPAFNKTEGAIKPFAIAVAASAFQAIDDAIGLARCAVELATQFRG